MRVSLLVIAVFGSIITLQAQDKNAENKMKRDTTTRLKEVVVTGEYQPQSIKNSVYRTRVISSEKIKLRAATNVQQVLNTELGFRFSNDLTLGTSDVSLMGMSGRNVKILLDGVPMVDRGDTRESLNQIDINTIERIEIVEGPLSVSYGTDALAGVINIITKSPGKETLGINARVQEETVGNEYSPFSKKGAHLQNIGANWQSDGWSVMGGVTHNEFNGFHTPGPLATAEEIEADKNRWKPKEQWLGNARLGYQKDNLNVWYRMDYVDETIISKGAYNPYAYKAVNQKYITDRYTQQLQGNYKVGTKLQLNAMLAYSDLRRVTRSVTHDYATGTEELTKGAGLQDTSKFNSTLIRATAIYTLSDQVALQPGAEANLDRASGARIKGSPDINDFAFFISSELRLIKGVVLRPGLRFIKNSVYDAPPVIPSLNAKVVLNDNLDLRVGYASGFRSPALRELYFDFFDASHSILGNPNLKAEQSNSFNGSLSFIKNTENENISFRSVLSGFYNNFKNRIDFGIYDYDKTITTLINISRFRTTGGTLENTLSLKSFQATLGFSYIGINNRYVEDAPKTGESNQFAWSPEINSNLAYTFSKIGTTVNLAYKFTGKKPFYLLHGGTSEFVTLEKTGSFNTADLMITKRLFKQLTLNAGVNNLFDVTTLTSTAIPTGGHSTGGPVGMNYGRSYVVGLSYNWTKK